MENNVIFFEFVEGFWIGRIFIDGDDARGDRVRGSKHLLEKLLGGDYISCWAEQELQRVSDAESTAR